MNTAASPNNTALADIPLLLAYVLLPVGLILLQVFGMSSQQTEATLKGWPWLMLAGLACISAMFRHGKNNSGMTSRIIATVGTLLFIVGVGLLFKFGLPHLHETPDLGPFMIELQPLVFLMFSMAWFLTFGLPQLDTFVRFGSCLGVLVAADTGQAMLFSTPIRLADSGTMAVLLYTALCVTFDKSQADRRIRLETTCILLGICATFNAAAIFAAAWSWLFMSRTRIPARLGVTFLLLTAMGLTFTNLHSLMSPISRYVTYWTWSELFKVFNEHQSLLYTGFPLTGELGVLIPPGLVAFWTSTYNTASLHLQLAQVEPLWLRLTAAWGIAAPALLLAIQTTLIIARPSRFGASLLAGLFALGLSTDILYNASSAIIVLLATIVAMHLSDDTRNPKEEA